MAQNHEAQSKAMHESVKAAHDLVRDAFFERSEAKTKDEVGLIGWEKVEGVDVYVFRQQPYYTVGEITGAQIRRAAPKTAEQFGLTDESYVEIGYSDVCITESPILGREYYPPQAVFTLVTPRGQGYVQSDVIELNVDSLKGMEPTWRRTADNHVVESGDLPNTLAPNDELIGRAALGGGDVYDSDVGAEPFYTPGDAPKLEFFPDTPDVEVELEDVQALQQIAELLKSANGGAS